MDKNINRIEIVKDIREANKEGVHALIEAEIFFNGNPYSTLKLETTIPGKQTQKARKEFFKVHTKKFYSFLNEYNLPVTGIRGEIKC